jgi:type IV pilus assembly protein PilA
VIIIGILAAIAIPVYLNQREQAFGATVQSDVRNGAGAATAFAADNNGVYTNMTATGAAGTGNDLITDYEWNVSPLVNATGVTVTGGGSGFTLTATHPNADASENTCVFTSGTGSIVCS